MTINTIDVSDKKLRATFLPMGVWSLWTFFVLSALYAFLANTSKPIDLIIFVTVVSLFALWLPVNRIVIDKYHGVIKVPGFTSSEGLGGGRLKLGAKLGITGIIKGTAAPKFEHTEVTDCAEDDESCYSFGADIGLSGEVILGGNIVGGYQEWQANDATDYGNYGKKKRANPKYDHCWKIDVGAKGKLEGSTKMTAAINATTDTCGKSECKYSVGKLTAKIEGDVALNLWLIEVKASYSPDPLIVTEGGSGNRF